MEEPITEKIEAFKRMQVDESQMERLYQAGECEELYDYMIAYCVYKEKEYATYAQYIGMNREMDDFIEKRME